MQLTPNLKLKKPEASDAVNIEDFNGNADVLDSEVTKLASTTDAGRMSAADKVKLNGIAVGAQVNPGAATTSAAGLMSAADKSKLDGVATGANNYTHPSSHPPSIITQDSSNRFVTDAEKVTWNAKASTAVATGSANGLMPAADKAALNAATNAATASTLVKRDSAGRMKAAVPAAADDVARKAETDAALTTAAGKVSKSGDTMTGPLQVDGDISARLSATPSKRAAIGYNGSYDEGQVAALDDGTSYKPITLVGPSAKFRHSQFSMGTTAYELWHDGRLRVNDGRLEFLDGGVWKPVGANQSIVPSDTVQYQNPATYTLSTVIAAKFIAKASGIVRIKCEIQTNPAVRASLYLLSVTYRNDGDNRITSFVRGGSATMQNAQYYGWDLPVGSAWGTNAQTGWYQSTLFSVDNISSWTEYVIEIPVDNAMPYMLLSSTGSPAWIRNVRVCYDVINL
jgi:hypothetical protein